MTVLKFSVFQNFDMPFHMHVQIRALLQIFVISLMLSIIVASIYLVVLGLTPKYSASYFCDPRLCEPGQIHIGCQPKSQFSFACIAPKKVPFLDYRKRITLKKHNQLRNKLAEGDVNGLKSANRMRIVTWSDELAHLAFLNTKQCVVEYDECCNTPKFPNVGQNIGISGPYEDMWFNQYKYATQDIMDHFYFDDHIQRFANIVNENTTQIGCGMTGFISHHKKLVYLLTCNYNSQPYPELPVYTSGPIGSKCRKGLNKEFKALCRQA